MNHTTLPLKFALPEVTLPLVSPTDGVLHAKQRALGAVNRTELNHINYRFGAGSEQLSAEARLLTNPKRHRKR